MITAAESQAPDAQRTRVEGIGWGGWLAIAGIILFAVGLTQVALAFDAMTVDQPGQWDPIYVALAVMAFLVIGLALRWRLAYAGAMVGGLYGLITELPRFVAGNFIGSWIFDFVTIVPSVMVVVGLLAAWPRYRRGAA